jgi:hypothetical protein
LKVLINKPVSENRMTLDKEGKRWAIGGGFFIVTGLVLLGFRTRPLDISPAWCLFMGVTYLIIALLPVLLTEKQDSQEKRRDSDS